MLKRAIHRILELALGIPLLVFGVNVIMRAAQAHRWIQEDPKHHHAFIATEAIIIFAILPLAGGCWFTGAAIVRMWPRRRVNPPAPNPDGPSGAAP